jgi:Cu(I)/Ag(I) efflux system periplasmic protein CusF
MLQPRTLLLTLTLALAASAALAQSTAGEVKAVNAAKGELTLKHEAIKNLDMPPMTMPYKVADKALLQGLKAGMKVRFDAIEKQGDYFVTRIAPAP